MREMTYKCPVCGYKELSRPPQDDTICPCCGTHFGYHDYATTHEDLRMRWISTGARWFSRARQQPHGWDAMTQLLESGLAIHLGAEKSETTVEFDIEPLDFSHNMKIARRAAATV
jgi:hypothetical protein